MNYNKDIIATIKERHSSRTFSNQLIEEWKRQELVETMKELKTGDFRFELINYHPEEGKKIGTYGMIKGAHAYLVGIMSKALAKDKEAAVNFGYSFEHVILKATELDLSTCWMVATFNTGDIKKYIEIEDHENIVIVSPLGYATKKSGGEKLARFLAASDKRKPWAELFYQERQGNELSRDEAGAYAQVLDMVRLGPSASNKQPWRLVKVGDYYDFYVGKTGYPETPGQKISKSYNDMGIAKAHFDLSAKKLNLKGQWLHRGLASSKAFEYAFSWKIIKAN